MMLYVTVQGSEYLSLVSMKSWALVFESQLDMKISLLIFFFCHSAILFVIIAWSAKVGLFLLLPVSMQTECVCRATSEPLAFIQFVHYISTSALV